MADPWAGVPGGSDSSSPAQPPAQGNPLQQLAKKVGKALKGVDKNAVMSALQEFAQLPAEGINAALGAPQRVNAARLSHASQNPLGVAMTTAAPLLGPLALMTPQGRQEAGHEVYAAFHPNDPSIEANAMAATGANKLLSKDPRFRGKLQNFAVQMGFQTATDPLTFTPAGTEVAGERALAGIGEMGTRALRSQNEVIRNTAEHLLTNVEERRGGFNPKEISTLNSIRQRGITGERMQHTSDAQLLAANRKALKAGELPDPIRQRLLREAYVDGTRQMREQAEALGYRPTQAEMAKAPTNTFDYNLRENYDPHTGAFHTPTAFNDLLLGQEADLRSPHAGMEQQQTGVPIDPSTLYDRVERRLAQGRAVKRFRQTQRQLQQTLGIGPEMAKSLATHTKFGGVKALQGLSQAQVDAMLVTGFPHMRNVGVMGFNALGEGGMARAMQFMVSTPPKHLMERLEEGGGSAHFGVRTPGPLARIVPQKVRQATTGLLDRWDQSLRAARLEQLDRSALSEPEKMDRVNQDLGAYNLKPYYTQLLKGLGANFPQWHNYIVPTAVGRAVLRRPDRVERLSRAVELGNDTFAPNSQYRMTLGGPNDEAASALADPARMIAGKGAQGRYPSYFGGPSSLGVLSYLLHPQGSSLSTRIAQTAGGLVPFGGIAVDALLNPFKNPLPPAARAATSTIGVYEQKRTLGSKRRTRQTQTTPSGGGDPWAGVP